ncbi:MAG TPA: hypothetical protein VMX74_00880 [Pirellulales bacterium]|nr:hypothetical protein [Pirellulales bacterium]
MAEFAVADRLGRHDGGLYAGDAEQFLGTRELSRRCFELHAEVDILLMPMARGTV